MVTYLLLPEALRARQDYEGQFFQINIIHRWRICSLGRSLGLNMIFKLP